MVLNVVQFNEKAPHFRKTAPRTSPQSTFADIPGLVSRFIVLQSKARTELRDAILLLDLAVQRARRLGNIVRDPALKKHFDDELQTIEELLQLARDKMSQL